MFGIRQKLMLGFGGLLATVVVIGALTMSQIASLGQAVDVILRENYRSVMACQNMKEALERMDSGVLFSFAGSRDEGQRYITENAQRFRDALNVELGNITLPGEQDKANHIRALFDQYSAEIPSAINPNMALEMRRAAYFDRLLPLFQEIKRASQEILDMNQANMSEANDNARNLATSAQRRMLTTIVVCATIALVFIFFIQRWILTPVRKLIESTREIREGNLDLVLNFQSRDEIGQLSESFNEMTSALRSVKKQDRFDLVRTKRATEEVFNALPTAIAVVNLNDVVEIATETAGRYFGLLPGKSIRDLGMDWLPELVERAMTERRMIERDVREQWVQQFIDGQEHFFLPTAVPIPVGSRVSAPTGTAVILKDVTLIHEQRELKRGVVSTVSHQLKTPLQSLRMAIHLLLEERVGRLNEKQQELASAAKEESDRLAAIVGDLLDLDRIESDGTLLEITPVAPLALVRDAVGPYLSEAKGRGVTLTDSVPDDLPDVLADRSRIGHVFANLLSNALRFTQPGGTITVSATLESDAVRFMVKDTGVGIAPEHIHRVFEPFYRVPGQDEKSGVGLGLAIVKEIVQAHGGAVSAQSAIGEGTRFSFTVPINARSSHIEE